MKVSPLEKDPVYNRDFRYVRPPVLSFPDGWQQVGGGPQTVWEWQGGPFQPGPVVIRHPGGPAAGLLQVPEVAVAAGELQRWVVGCRLASEPPGLPVYLKVLLAGKEGTPVAALAFTLRPEAEAGWHRRVFATAPGTFTLRLGVYLAGPGTLTVHEFEARRLYPRPRLRLDEKGRACVGRVEQVGEIVNPVRLAGPVKVKVQATVSADIRDLTPVRDGVRVYGAAPLPLATTPGGVLKVAVAERGYHGVAEELVAGPVPAATAAQDLSGLRLFSYALLNRGTEPARAWLEVSPDAVHWAVDSEEREIGPGGLAVLTSKFFLRYVRLVASSAAATPLTVWFQAQG
ncbi:MAG: DUF6385 domain-containing protein [Moorellales bacterium]